jgi:hypothetical protein
MQKKKVLEVIRETVMAQLANEFPSEVSPQLLIAIFGEEKDIKPGRGKILLLFS